MLTFPADLQPIDGGFGQSVKSLSGGQSLSGYEQVDSQMNDRWTASYVFNINSDDRVLALRAFILSMRGRKNSVLLPAFDLARRPMIPAHTASAVGSSTAAFWYQAYDELKGTPYFLAPLAGIGGTVTVTSLGSVRVTGLSRPVVPGMWLDLLGDKRQVSDIDVVSPTEIRARIYPPVSFTTVAKVEPAARLAAPASLNATSIAVVMEAGTAPKPGHLFSIGSRLYSILAASGGSPFTFEIWPWLRADVAINTAVNFTAPACEMRFATDDQGADVLTSLSQLRFGKMPLKFDEVSA